jgi:maltose alpha-D-glucosyltransferase/alpha-amylase
MAIAQEDRFPITDIMRQTPEIPVNCQWAMFLRNHDELTLEMVTDAERDYLWSTYAADPRARINLGIRRRLAPLMDNDRRKIELMNSILLSMPGTPIIYYGDEIGMGDNIYLGDRNSVRTPMQWTPDRNGGFSRSDPAQLYLPCIMDPVYGYNAVNVEAQTRSLSSLLNWMKRLIGVRKSTKVFGRGTLTFIRPANRAVLAYVRQLNDDAILCVANISRSAQAVELDMGAWKGRVPQEMLGRTNFPRIGELPYLVTLPPYGFFWFSLNTDPNAEPQKILPRDITTLVLGHGWENALSGWTRRTFEAEVLPSFMPERRWFADKDSRTISTKVSVAIPIENDSGRIAAVVVESHTRQGVSRYFLPLTVRWSRYTAIDKSPAAILSAVRRGASEGTLLDATAEPDFISIVLKNIRAAETVGSNGALLEFRPTSVFTAAAAPEIHTIAPIDREQSNSSVIVDNKYVVKVLRRVAAGIHPEFEMGRYLADVAHFQNSPALLGTVELVEGETHTALCTVHAFIENQGDAWGITGASLDRLIDEQRLVPDEPATETSEMTSMLQRMRQIGRRTAELHRALASHPDVESFAPEPISQEDSAGWSDAIMSRADHVAEILQENADRLGETANSLAQKLRNHREAIRAHIGELKGRHFTGSKIRVHGDFHLGQVLIAKDDAYILDFEGEPRQSLENRRLKAPPARDVAGFIRSIDYATSAAIDRAPNITAEERAVLGERIRGWGARLSAAFWDSYREALAGVDIWPADDAKAQELLNLFQLEKVFYEIEYEVTNRPTWAHIPLAGTLRMLAERGVMP